MEQSKRMSGAAAAGNVTPTPVTTFYIQVTYTQCCGSWMFIPDPGSTSKNLSILIQKIVFNALGNMILVVHPGSRSRIRILIC
jgi:hypothetical protein